MSAQRNGLRSCDSQIVKDFGSVKCLPLKPLTRKDILARFNSVKGLSDHRVKGCSKDDSPCNNAMRSEKNVAAILAVEIQELYRKFGLKTVIFQQVCAKILAVKKAYYKSRKNLQAKAKFSDSEFVSFRAKKQPREILREDMVPNIHRFFMLYRHVSYSLTGMYCWCGFDSFQLHDIWNLWLRNWFLYISSLTEDSALI